MKIKITLTEEMLGMTPNSQDIHREYIASKAPDAASMEEEVAAHGVDEIDEKGTTVFARNENGEPCLWNYQIKGMMKDCMQMLIKAGKAGYEGGKYCSEIKAYKKAVDGLIFVLPRMIPIQLSGPMGTCSRPLRAMTMQGERVSIAKSETVPSGSVIEFEVKCLDPKLENAVCECFEYGKLRGLGQWRNSGKGTYEWEPVE